MVSWSLSSKCSFFISANLVSTFGFKNRNWIIRALLAITKCWYGTVKGKREKVMSLEWTLRKDAHDLPSRTLTDYQEREEWKDDHHLLKRSGTGSLPSHQGLER